MRSASDADFTDANLSAGVIYVDLNGSTIHLAADVTGFDLTNAKELTEELLRDLASRGAKVESTT